MTRTVWLVPLLLVLGCGNAEVASPEVETLELDVDIREHAQVRVERRGSELTVRLTLSRGFGVAAEPATLSGRGTLERFPEADVVLIAAKLASPAVSGGPCGDEPVSLALALHRRGTASRVSGSLTPYCGKDVWSGVPARNPLRLSSTVPKPE